MIYTNFREIDKAGRIVISKDIRNHLNIKPTFFTLRLTMSALRLKRQRASAFFAILLII